MLLKNLARIFSAIKYSKFNFCFMLISELWYAFTWIFSIVIVSNIILNIEKSQIENINKWVIIFVIISLISMILSLFSGSMQSVMSKQISWNLTNQILKEYIFLDNTKVEEYWTWKMNNILFTWVDAVLSFLKIFVFTIVEIFSIIYVFVLILQKSPNIYYFLAFLFLFIVMLFIMYWSLKIMQKLKSDAKKVEIEIDGAKVKILMSKFEILQNQKIDYELDFLSKKYDEMTKIWFWWNFKKNWLHFIWDFILNWLYLSVFLFIWYWIITKNYTMSLFSLLIWLIQNLSRYTRSIRSYFSNLVLEYKDAQKMFETLDNIPKYWDDSHLSDLKFTSWNIKLENITFWYNSSKNIFDKFSLNLEWWKKYAFVWPSWWGKSTLIKLIAWYIKPENWKILVDNQDLSEVNMKSFFKNIWYLTQEPSVFDGSIMENLLYALDKSPSNDEISKIIKSAKCEFIYEFKDWLNTQIWEKWVKLSGWQRQRLAIAKIMLKNPKIILLDEPTSALDSFSEEEVSQAFENLFAWKTVIVVAHRLQTVKNSDIIFYLENWKIIESWNHNELTLKKWNYYKMIELQSGF